MSMVPKLRRGASAAEVQFGYCILKLVLGGAAEISPNNVIRCMASVEIYL